MSFSQTVITGFLGNETELKYTKNQKAILTISVGVKEQLRSTDNKEKQAKTYWHKCRCWGKWAENYKIQLKKGDKVFIKGTLIYDQWEDKAGRKHKDAVIEIEHLEKMYYENVTIDFSDL